MTYDEAIARLEAIMHELENDEAMPLSVFKDKEREAKQLIAFCDKEIQKIEEALNTDAEA